MWIAPSGGRDRPDADGHWTPDKFDPTAVELMASLIGRAKKPGHLYPMAMYSYPIMPPPKKVREEGGGGELTGFVERGGGHHDHVRLPRGGVCQPPRRGSVPGKGASAYLH